MRINSKLKGVVAAATLLLTPQALALNVFACEPEYAALINEIAPDANIFSATTALQDPHFVQARPSLIAKLRRADLAVCAGAELEVGWLPALQMKASNPNVRDGQLGMFYAADHVEALGKVDKVDRSMGDIHADGNPHFHFSPTRVEQLAQALTERLGQLDPDNRDQYQHNLVDFQQRWQQASSRWQQQAMPLRGKKVIAYHSSFEYLFDWLGISQIADLEPKPGLPPTTSHLASLLTIVEQQQPMAVVHTGYQDSRGAAWLGKRGSLTVIELTFGPGVNDIDDLFQLYDRVIQQLLDAAG